MNDTINLDYKIKINNTYTEPFTEEYLIQICKKLFTPTLEELQEQTEKKKKIAITIDFFRHLPKKVILENFSEKEILVLLHIVGQAATGNIPITGQQGIKIMKKASKYCNDKIIEEFIIYWLPKLEENEYNLIRFENLESINEQMSLDINPTPDTLIRIFMKYKPLKNKIEIKEQELSSPVRNGFTVVEWGGSLIK